MLMPGRVELEAKAEIIVSKFNTYCSLCSKEIKKDTVVLKTKDRRENTYLIHTMCEVETGVHKVYYQREVKQMDNQKKRQTKPNKKIHLAEKNTPCQFCRKIINKNSEWVGNGRGRKSKKYHPDCWKRYQKTITTTKNNLRLVTAPSASLR